MTGIGPVVGAVRRTMEPLEHPEELSAHRARKRELAALESLVAGVEYGLEILAESLCGVVVVQRAKSGAVACADTEAAAEGQLGRGL